MSLVRFRSEAPAKEIQQGFQYAAVAHLVERHLAKVEVASSSLVGRSNTKPSLMQKCKNDGFFVVSRYGSFLRKKKNRKIRRFFGFCKYENNDSADIVGAQSVRGDNLNRFLQDHIFNE